MLLRLRSHCYFSIVERKRDRDLWILKDAEDSGSAILNLFKRLHCVKNFSCFLKENASRHHYKDQ
jgi:hypothetical protein